MIYKVGIKNDALMGNSTYQGNENEEDSKHKGAHQACLSGGQKGRDPHINVLEEQAMAWVISVKVQTQ